MSICLYWTDPVEESVHHLHSIKMPPIQNTSRSKLFSLLAAKLEVDLYPSSVLCPRSGQRLSVAVKRDIKIVPSWIYTNPA